MLQIARDCGTILLWSDCVAGGQMGCVQSASRCLSFRREKLKMPYEGEPKKGIGSKMVAEKAPPQAQPPDPQVGVVAPRSCKETFICDICGQDGLTESEMRSHVLIEHVEGEVSCPFCDLEGTTLEEMTLHVNSHHLDFMSPSKLQAESNEPSKRAGWGQSGCTRPGECGSDVSDMETSNGSPSIKEGSSYDNISKPDSVLTRYTAAVQLKDAGKKHTPQDTAGSGAPAVWGERRYQYPDALVAMEVGNETNTPNEKSSSANGVGCEGFGSGSLKRAKLSLQVSQGGGAACSQQGRRAPGRCVPGGGGDGYGGGEAATKENKNGGSGSGSYSCPLCGWSTSTAADITTHVNVAHLDHLTPTKAPEKSGLRDRHPDSDPDPLIRSRRGFNDLNKETTATRQTAGGRPAVPQTANILEGEDDRGSGHGSALPSPLQCPFCGLVSTSGPALEMHVHGQHADILSPDRSRGVTPQSGDPSPTTPCPVCGMGFSDALSLQNHVEGHFSAQQTPVSEQEDCLLAQELEKKDMKAARRKEEEDFKKLQLMMQQYLHKETYGMAGQGGFKQQAELSMERAVSRGQMSITDFYTKKWQFQQAASTGVDDGTSTTKGIIDKLEQYYRGAPLRVSAHWLCSPLDHYAASYGDKGWGCGYRNFQMMLSCLSQNNVYQQVVFNGRPLIPSLPKVQRLIEAAWLKGFDRAGCEQLGGKLVNTTKWIGATEIVATLSSLKIKCQLVDFHAPSGKDSTHPDLFSWVRDYFKDCGDFKPPLYLQHQGHSRTIIGVEALKDGSLRMLIFDPSCSRKQMSQFVDGPISANLMRSVCRPLHSLKAKQYQIVAIRGVLNDREFEESKMLKSDRFP